MHFPFYFISLKQFLVLYLKPPSSFLKIKFFDFKIKCFMKLGIRHLFITKNFQFTHKQIIIQKNIYKCNLFLYYTDNQIMIV